MIKIKLVEILKKQIVSIWKKDEDTTESVE